MNELGGWRRYCTVADGKVQLFSPQLQLNIYPVGPVGLTGDMLEGILHKGHQYEWRDTQLFKWQLIDLTADGDIIILPEFFQLDTVLQVVNLFSEGDLAIVAFVELMTQQL
jgi:hypothetical protein